jgi:hypothetical protein
VSFSATAQINSTSKPVSTVYNNSGTNLIQVKRADGVNDTLISKKSATVLDTRYYSKPHTDSIQNGYNTVLPALGGDVTNVGNAVTVTKMNGITKNYYNPTSPIQDQINAKQVRTSLIGPIYSKSSWANTNDFVNNGLTSVTASGGGIVIVGSGSNYNTSQPSLDLKVDTSGYENFWIDGSYTIGTARGANTRGLVLTHQSTGAGLYVTGAGIDLSSNSTYGGHVVIQISNYGDYRVSVSSTSMPSYNVGDKIAMWFERSGNILVATARNITQQGPIVTAIAFYSSFPSTIQPNLPGTGITSIKAIGASGDTYTLNSLTYGSKDIKNANLFFIGHSKFGLGANYNTGWIKLLGNNYDNIVMNGFGGEQMIDIWNRRHAIRDTHPQNAIVYMDPANDTDTALFKTNYKKTIDSLHLYGITTYHLDGIYESAKNIQWFRDYISRTFPAQYVIKVYDQLKAAGPGRILNADSLHLNGHGDTVLYKIVVASGKLPGGHPFFDYAKIANLYSMDGHDNDSGNGTNILNNYIWDGLKATDAQGHPYIQLTNGGHTIFGSAGNSAQIDFDHTFGGIGATWVKGFDGSALLIYNNQFFVFNSGGIIAPKFNTTGTGYFKTYADSTTQIVSYDGGINYLHGFKTTPLGVQKGQVNAGYPRSSLDDATSTTQGATNIPELTTTQRDAILKETLFTVTVTGGGTSYHNGDVITFSGGGNINGANATGTINVTSGVITSITLVQGGFGYGGVPSTATVSGPGSGATFTYTMTWKPRLTIFNHDTQHYNVIANGVWVEIPNKGDITFNTLTTTGTRGPATLSAGVLNIPIPTGLPTPTDGQFVGSYDGGIPVYMNVADAIYTASDANLTVPTFNAYGDFVTLPAITANRTVTLPSPVGLTGQHIKLRNMNASGNAWSFASTVKDTGGTTITDIANLAFTIIESDGANWVKTN